MIQVTTAQKSLVFLSQRYRLLLGKAATRSGEPIFTSSVENVKQKGQPRMVTPLIFWFRELLEIQPQRQLNDSRVTAEYPIGAIEGSAG